MSNQRLLLGLGLGMIGLVLAALMLRALFLPLLHFDTEHIVLNPAYRLQGTINDSLVVSANEITLEPGSVVNGSAALVGERVRLDGVINGDLTVSADSLTLGEGAVVNGRTTLLVDEVTLAGTVTQRLDIHGSHLTIAPTARLIAASACITTLDNPSAVRLDPCVPSDRLEQLAPAMALQQTLAAMDPGLRTLITLASSALFSVVLAALAALVLTLNPDRVLLSEQTLHRAPLLAASNGVAVVLLAVGLLSAGSLIVGLIPAAFLVVVLLGVVGAAVLGILLLTGLAAELLILGRWLLARLKRHHTPPMLAALFGGLVVSLALHLPALLPMGGWVGVGLFGVLLLLALGAGVAPLARHGLRLARVGR